MTQEEKSRCPAVSDDGKPARGGTIMAVNSRPEQEHGLKQRTAFWGMGAEFTPATAQASRSRVPIPAWQ